MALIYNWYVYFAYHKQEDLFAILNIINYELYNLTIEPKIYRIIEFNLIFGLLQRLLKFINYNLHFKDSV